MGTDYVPQSTGTGDKHCCCLAGAKTAYCEGTLNKSLGRGFSEGL